jgi:DNA-3-methyladenine glycosylase II
MPSPHSLAVADLVTRDPVFAGLVADHGPMRLSARPKVDERFAWLAESVAHQQLAGKAAIAIWGRVRASVDGPFTPDAVLALDPGVLEGAGLSRSKADAIRNMATLSLAGAIRFDRAGRMTDDEVVEMLTQVRGVGPWTAHMFLLFSLHRLDVWPVGDFGVRAGYTRAWSLSEMPTPRQLDVLGDRFRPYRSVVAWYCWRAADTPAPISP